MTAGLASVFGALARDVLGGADRVDVARVWRPHPGPQTAFLASDAYEVLYGGAAGGGKTDALLYGPLDQMHIPAARALFLRISFPELQQAMDRAGLAFPRFGAVWHEQKKRWLFPSGAFYEFGYCANIKEAHQYFGDEYSDMAFDELGLIADERVWTFLQTRNRSTDPRVKLRMRASANPGQAGHAWLKKRFVDQCKPDGTPILVDGLTRAFFAALLADNPTLDKNDPTYRVKLERQPEQTRRQLLEGDWSAGDGLALSELSASVHLVDPFRVPDLWYQWGALDWGFNHPFAAGWFACDPDGNAYLCDTAMGRRLLPNEMAERIKETLPVPLLRKFVAGHDCWNEVRARGENTPTIADQFRQAGIVLMQANISRKTGLNNLRAYLTYDRHDLAHKPPRFFIMRTPANLRVFETLESMVTDPDDPEDALKVDADEYGQGGDDAYDMVRYGLAARPLKGRVDDTPEWKAFSPEALKADVERLYRNGARKALKQKLTKYGKGNLDPFVG